MNKREFFSGLQAGGLSDTIELNLTDSLFYLHYYVQDIRAEMFVLANIIEQNDKTIIRLDSFLTGSVTGGLIYGIDEDVLTTLDDVVLSQHEEYFQKYFIDQFLNGTTGSGRLYYYNKNIYDEHLNRHE